MSKKTRGAAHKKGLIEDVTIEELLREELEQDGTPVGTDSQVTEEDSQIEHPEAGEVVAEEGDELDSQTPVAEENEDEDSEVAVTEETSEEEDSQEAPAAVAESDDADEDDDSQVVTEEEEDEDSEVVAEETSDEDEDSEVVTEEDSQEEVELDFTEDVKALQAAGKNLSEDFKLKAGAIFEATVRSHVARERKRLAEAHRIKLQKQVTTVAHALTEKVDAYLTAAVSEWVKLNQVAVDTSLRTEMAESFMASLKNLFVESYVEVPTSKRNLYKELEVKTAKLTEEKTAAEKKLSEATSLLQKFQRDSIIAEASNGLASSQVERLKELTKDVDFGSEAAFTSKVKTIKESYFKASSGNPRPKTGTKVSVLNEGTNNADQSEHIADPEMRSIVEAISRTARR